MKGGVRLDPWMRDQDSRSTALNFDTQEIAEVQFNFKLLSFKVCMCTDSWAGLPQFLQLQKWADGGR